MPGGIGQYSEKSLLVSAMPNVLKVLPLTILLTLGTGAGASTTKSTTSPAGPSPATATEARPVVSAKAAPPPAKELAKPADKATPKPAPTAKASGGAAPKAAGPAKPRVATAAEKAKPSATTARRATGSKRASGTTTAARPANASTKTAVASRPATRPALDGRGDGPVDVESGAALVVDSNGQVVYSKNPDEVLPIASITKLMTAVVVLDSGLPLDEVITISADDKDFLRNTHSRLQVGSQLTRRELLHIALMSSENRAAAALGRTHPAGKAAFVQLMNAKARVLGMRSTHFADTTGLDGGNVSTARDLVKLAQAAATHPLIREYTTTAESEVEPGTRGTPMLYRNSNRLVRGGHWDIQLSKTGYLNEAGRCLLMQAEVAGKPLVFVFLSGPGRQTPMGDANRIRVWLENGPRTG
jgi:D-alanyl-D-alanine endopeptidase (penicillin-binding protein 7)